jgi:hypothetical protein
MFLWHGIFYLAHASLAWHLLFLLFLHSPYSLFEKHWREIYDMKFLFWRMYVTFNLRSTKLLST